MDSSGKDIRLMITKNCLDGFKFQVQRVNDDTAA